MRLDGGVEAGALVEVERGRGGRDDIRHQRDAGVEVDAEAAGQRDDLRTTAGN